MGQCLAVTQNDQGVKIIGADVNVAWITFESAAVAAGGKAVLAERGQCRSEQAVQFTAARK